MTTIPIQREPVFCFTCDTDWNPDAAMKAILDLFATHRVKLTVFATHATPALSGYDNLQIGVHPNFLPGSTHGTTMKEVLDHVFGLFPRAETYRSHSHFDNQQLSEEMQRLAIEALIARLRPGGAYLMVEGSQQAFRALNHYRSAAGLAEIPDVYPGNESSRKLDETWLADLVEGTRVARIESTENFSFYNLASKVLHPLLVAPDEPKFSAAINGHAARVQDALSARGAAIPDVGAGKLWVIRRSA